MLRKNCTSEDDLFLVHNFGMEKARRRVTEGWRKILHGNWPYVAVWGTYLYLLTVHEG